MKVFNKSNPPRKFLLTDGQETVFLKSGEFATLNEGYRDDITFRRAVAAGDIVEYEDVSEAKELEKERAEEKPATEPVPDGMDEANAKAKKTTRTKKTEE